MTLVAAHFSAGPILGNTTDTRVRLWGRGEGGLAPAWGVIHLFDSGSLAQATTFALDPANDYTGTVDLVDLRPGTRYNYQAGFVHSDAAPVAGEVDLSHGHQGSVRTRVASPSTFTFLLGSCRNLKFQEDGRLRNLAEADTSFRTMNRLITQVAVDPDLLLLLGDQIYADSGGAGFLTKEAEGFAEGYRNRYRRAFSTPEFVKTVSSIPTYMILDDHEIMDNWHEDLLKAPGPDGQRNVAARRAALDAYTCYQQSHGPLGWNASQRFYEVDFEQFGLFVLDLRTERHPSAKPPTMVSEGQLEALNLWLKRATPRFKFVATSVPFFPDVWFDPLLKLFSKDSARDRWSGFVAQRNKILETLRTRSGPPVTFLGGDVHSSFCAELFADKSAEKSGRRLAYSIVSSGLIGGYPLPGFSLRTPGVQGATDYRCRLVDLGAESAYCGSNNFTLVRHDGTNIDVEIWVENSVTQASGRFGACRLPAQ